MMNLYTLYRTIIFILYVIMSIVLIAFTNEALIYKKNAKPGLCENKDFIQMRLLRK